MKMVAIVSIMIALGFFLVCIYSLCKIASASDDELEERWGYKDEESKIKCNKGEHE